MPTITRLMSAFCLALCLLTASLTGCGEKAPPPAKPDQALEDFRRELTAASQHGEIGSGLDPVKERFDALKADKPELASKIEKQFRSFVLSNTAEKRQEIAAEIVKEFPAAANTP